MIINSLDDTEKTNKDQFLQNQTGNIGASSKAAPSSKIETNESEIKNSPTLKKSEKQNNKNYENYRSPDKSMKAIDNHNSSNELRHCEDQKQTVQGMSRNYDTRIHNNCYPEPPYCQENVIEYNSCYPQKEGLNNCLKYDSSFKK